MEINSVMRHRIVNSFNLPSGSIKFNNHFNVYSRSSGFFSHNILYLEVRKRVILLWR
jgi:hypothetical protein